jgi:hypothetical protein
MRPFAIAACVAVACAAPGAEAARGALPRIRAVVVSATTGGKLAETTGAAPRPLAAAIADGRGGFLTAGPHGVARIRPDGTADPAFHDVDVPVTLLAQAKGVLVAVGPGGMRFLSPRTGTALHPALPLAPAGTRAFPGGIATSGSSVYVVGSSVRGRNGSSQLALAANVITGTRTAWQPVIRNGIATRVAAAGAVVYLSGTFRHVGGIARCGLAAVWAGSGAVRGWHPAACPPETPDALAATAHTVFLGRLHGFAALRADSGLPLTWSARTSAALAGVGAGALAVSGTTLYVGTVADAVGVALGGVTRRGWLALNTTNGTVRAWTVSISPHQNGKVVAVSGPRALVYGSFSG